MIRAGALFLAILCVWLVAYASGAFPWLGAAWMSRSAFGAGAITIIGENRAGSEIGLHEFLFFAGQEIVIDYDVEVHAGSLYFHVFQPFDGELGDGPSRYLSESGHGTWTIPVKKTGLYHVTINGSPLHGPGKGWDLSYSVKWGARPASH